mmetsp:Transcript_3956/g.12650  ORF Transcript_3956/g.12650 Transcript_3956/m.12650 type:complete len:254 (+) Transcript_3956:137-898(+)
MPEVKASETEQWLIERCAPPSTRTPSSPPHSTAQCDMLSQPRETRTTPSPPPRARKVSPTREIDFALASTKDASSAPFVSTVDLAPSAPRIVTHSRSRPSAAAECLPGGKITSSPSQQQHSASCRVECSASRMCAGEAAGRRKRGPAARAAWSAASSLSSASSRSAARQRCGGSVAPNRSEASARVRVGAMGRLRRRGGRGLRRRSGGRPCRWAYRRRSRRSASRLAEAPPRRAGPRPPRAAGWSRAPRARGC